MKTLKNLLLTLTFLVLTALSTAAAIFGEENLYSISKNAAKGGTKIQDFNTRAIANESLIPMVTLPVVEIVAYKEKHNVVSLVKNGNQMIPAVDLPEVAIYAASTSKKYCLKSSKYNGETIAMYDLPEIIISAESYSTQLVSLFNVDNLFSEDVNLPKSTNRTNDSENNLISCVLYQGKYIPVINLPLVEVTTDKINSLIAMNENAEINLGISRESISFDEANFDAISAELTNSIPSVNFLIKGILTKKIYLYLAR